jgi:hypothetical protein
MMGLRKGGTGNSGEGQREGVWRGRNSCVWMFFKLSSTLGSLYMQMYNSHVVFVYYVTYIWNLSNVFITWPFFSMWSISSISLIVPYICQDLISVRGWVDPIWPQCGFPFVAHCLKQPRYRMRFHFYSVSFLSIALVFKWYFVVLVVLKDVHMLPILNNFVIIIVSLLTWMKATHFCFCFCGGFHYLGLVFLSFEYLVRVVVVMYIVFVS